MSSAVIVEILSGACAKGCGGGWGGGALGEAANPGVRGCPLGIFYLEVSLHWNFRHFTSYVIYVQRFHDHIRTLQIRDLSCADRRRGGGGGFTCNA